MFKIVFPALLLAFGLTGCGNNQMNDQDRPSLPAEKTSLLDEDKAPALQVRDTELGEIVVDGKGRTVYTYADDDQGAAKSTCKGGCLTAWPPVPAPKKPDVDELSGDVGIAKASDGSDQLTYNGWPLYYYAEDKKPGDTTGQGEDDEWWVLDEAGEKVESH